MKTSIKVGPVLEMRGMTAGYGGVAAVRAIDLRVEPGEVVALLGPNGAGKTTTLLAACGLVAPLSGTVTFGGRPLDKRVERNARQGIVLVPDNRGVFHSLSVEDNLRLASKDAGAVDRVLAQFPQLGPLRHRRCGLLSGGEQQMLALAKALLAQPRVLLIDEMSLGLSPIAVQRLLPVVRRLADEQDVAVLLVEQHIDLALSIADRAVVLHHGGAVLTGTAAEFRAQPDAVQRAYFGGTPTTRTTADAPTGELVTLQQDHVADESSARPSSARPAWVTDDQLTQWATQVCREATENGGAAAEPVTSIAAYDLSPITTVQASSAADAAEAVTSARRAQGTWAATAIKDRGRILLTFHDLLMKRQDEVLDLIQWETGKSRYHAWMEVAQVASLARHYARRGKHYLAPTSVRGFVPGLTKVREVRVPKGVVGIVSPWNYPLYLGTGDLVPALMAGNAVVSKPDSQTALTLLWARQLMTEAGLPVDLWKVVVGDGETVGNALVDSVDYISFTGSTATGRRVAQRAAGRIIGASLELGGKNPLIVRHDADIEAAAAGTASASFANTGQMCIHTERVYVHESVYARFRDELVKVTEGLTIGQAFDFSVDLGPLISTKQLEAVTAHVDDAVAKGATTLTGGRARPDLGPLCFEPTILEGVTDEMAVCAEETFGPVISLYPFTDDDEAIALANRGSYGLSASIWSKDADRAAVLAQRVRAGSVSINDGAAAAAGSIEAGMGGMGDSGLGRRHGAEGIRKYTESQTIATQRLMPLGPPRGKPVAGFVRQSNSQLALIKKLGLR